MIKVDENLLGLWYVDLPRGQDYMGALSRHDGRLRLTWRIRDRNGAPADAWDRHSKRWHVNELKYSTTPAIAIEKVRTIVAMVAAVSGEKLTMYELLRGELSVAEFTDKLLAAPFAQVRTDWKGEGPHA